MPLTEAQFKLAQQLKWYHALDFGNYQAVGRISPPFPPNVTLFGVMDMLSGMDVAGMSCLDIGPAHGLISFGLALKGANVTAINIGGSKPPQIALGEEALGVRIDYRSPVSLAEAPAVFPEGSFDLIVCAGVMYHLLNPADVFFRLRPLLKRNGLLVMETVYAADVKEPVLVLNSEAGSFPQPTTYFLPSASALTGLAKLACFDVEATRVNSPRRFSLIGRAVLPDEVSQRSALCAVMHKTGFEDPMFQIAALSRAAESPIRYNGTRGHKAIDVTTYVPDFPPHPKAVTNPVGQMLSLQSEG